jgi:N-acetylneuraminic acid mutarotase
VTEARTGTPLLAEIAITGTPAGPPSPGDQIWTDPATGAYRITLAEGNIYTFAVRAGAGGYQTASRTFGPLVADRTEDFALASWVVSGTVTDARTHWPLYARITVTGTPAGPPAPDNEFWTDPSTGVYSIKLAEGNTYTLAVAARTAGYKAGSSTFGPLAADRTEDFSLAADEGKCAVPGYSFTYGFLTDFEATDGGFAGGGANSTWLWGPPGSGPSGGHSGAKCWGTVLSGSSASSWASSGDIDLSAAAGHAIVLTWWDWFRDGGKASVHSEVSKDGGVSWDNPWDFSLAGNWNWTSRSATLDASYAVPNFRARFVFSSSSSAPGASYWVDDVFVAISCDPGAGGIVAGMVTDKNSGVPVNAAAVAASSGSATSGADGFYTLYLPGGPASLTASKAGAGYGSVSGDVAVVPGSAVIHDFALPAANLSCQDWVKVTVGLGQKVEVALALTNEGEQPVRFRLMEGASQVAPGGREPLPEDCSGTAPDLGPVAPGAGSPRSGVEEGWQAFTQIPTGARNSFAGVSCDGQSLYAFGGIAPSGAVLNESWEYYPSGDFWCPLAPMPKALYGVDAACLGGRVYVVGGYDGATYSTDLQTYDTATDTWTSSPAPVPFNPMAAGYGGKLYTFGGYRKPSTSLLRVKETWSYDPSTRVWAQWAEMPIANVVGKAVTVGDFIYQIGGSGWGGSGTKMVQRFDPAANAWDGTGPQLLTGRTSPMAAWYGDALYVLGGWDSANVAPAGSVETYDPALWPSGAWTAKVQTIPVPVSNMAGACAASRIWLEGGRDTATTSVAANQALDDGGTCHFDPSPGLPWLSESLTAGSLAPGESQSAMLAFDAGVPEVPGTGTYQGLLKVATDSPGGLSLVTVRMEVVAFTCALDCLATVPASGQAGVPLSFSAVATPSGCSGEPSFAWTFGDGTSTAEQNPSKVYSDDGAYTWTMTASIQGVSCSQSGTVSVTSPVTKPGDCNGDGTVSIGEVQKAINMFLGTLAPDCGADFNGDGSVSIGEVQKVINGFLGHATSA